MSFQWDRERSSGGSKTEDRLRAGLGRTLGTMTESGGGPVAFAVHPITLDAGPEERRRALDWACSATSVVTANGPRGLPVLRLRATSQALSALNLQRTQAVAVIECLGAQVDWSKREGFRAISKAAFGIELTN